MRARRPDHRPGDGGLHGRRRVPVDLRLPPRGRRRLPRAARRGRRRARARPQLPLAARGARGGERALRRRVRRRLPAAARVRRVPRPGVRPPGGAARHRQGVVRRARARTGAPARPARSPARARARGLRGGGARRDRRPLRRGHRRGAVRGGARRVGLPTYRATGRGYFGQQQVVDLLLYLRLLHNRYDDVALASGARVAVRRGLERRADADPPRRLAPSALRRDRARGAGDARGGRRAARARLPAAVRAPRRGDAATLARASVRARPGRARLRPGRARAVGRPPPLREPPQARAARALLRGAPRARRRRVRPLRAGAGGRRRGAARGGRRGGGRGRDPAADDPRREGARVQGRGRRRRRPRQGAARLGRDPRALGRPLRLPRRRPGDEPPQGRLRLRRGARGAAAGGGRGAPAPLLRRDDAGGRPAARLGRDRPRLDRRRVDADRLGTRPARLRGGAGGLGRGAGRARPRRRAPAAARGPVPRRAGRARVEPAPEEQLSLFAEGGAAEPLPPAPILPALEGIPTPPLHRLRRLSFTGLLDLRAVLVQVLRALRGGMRERRPSAAADGGAGMAATDLGSAVHALLERDDAGLPPDVSAEDAERIATLVQAWHDWSSEPASRRSRTSSARRTSPSSTTASSSTGTSTCSTVATGAHWSSTTRPTRSASCPPPRSSSTSTGSSASSTPRVLPRRRRRGRSRLRVPRVPRGAGGGDVPPRGRADARGRAHSRDRGDPRRRVPATTVRVRLQHVPGARPGLRRPAAPDGSAACRLAAARAGDLEGARRRRAGARRTGLRGCSRGRGSRSWGRFAAMAPRGSARSSRTSWRATWFWA